MLSDVSVAVTIVVEDVEEKGITYVPSGLYTA